MLSPRGVFVGRSGTIYVAEGDETHRMIRWHREATIGEIIVGGNEQISQTNQLGYPRGLPFDAQGNLFVADDKKESCSMFSSIV